MHVHNKQTVVTTATGRDHRKLAEASEGRAHDGHIGYAYVGTDERCPIEAHAPESSHVLVDRERRNGVEQWHVQLDMKIVVQKDDSAKPMYNAAGATQRFMSDVEPICSSRVKSLPSGTTS